SVDVGSEPVGLALSPTGAKLFVSEFAEGRVSVVDTAKMEIIGAIEQPLHPRALAGAKNADPSGGRGVGGLPRLYGDPVPGGEATDTGRTGRVRIYHVSDLTPSPTPILFQPIDSGFAPSGSPDGTPTVMTSPNQLYSVAIFNGKIYVTSVSASPEP